MIEQKRRDMMTAFTDNPVGYEFSLQVNRVGADGDRGIGDLAAQAERRRSRTVIHAAVTGRAQSDLLLMAFDAGNSNPAAREIIAVAHGASDIATGIDDIAVEIDGSFIHPALRMGFRQRGHDLFLTAPRMEANGPQEQQADARRSRYNHRIKPHRSLPRLQMVLLMTIPTETHAGYVGANVALIAIIARVTVPRAVRLK